MLSRLWLEIDRKGLIRGTLLNNLYNGLKIDWDQDLDILASITGNRGKWIETG